MREHGIPAGVIRELPCGWFAEDERSSAAGGQAVLAAKDDIPRLDGGGQAVSATLRLRALSPQPERCLHPAGQRVRARPRSGILPRNWVISSAISSWCVAVAKCPVSSMWISASGRSSR